MAFPGRAPIGTECDTRAAKADPRLRRAPTISKQTASRVVLRSSFVGAQRKPVSRLPGARSNGTAVKTSASWNPFAQNSNKAGIVGSQGRDDYESEDVEYYFNYMGILADEGSNDRMDALLAADKHPIDVILLFAAAEGDVPKIEDGKDRLPCFPRSAAAK